MFNRVLRPVSGPELVFSIAFLNIALSALSFRLIADVVIVDKESGHFVAIVANGQGNALVKGCLAMSKVYPRPAMACKGITYATITQRDLLESLKALIPPAKREGDLDMTLMELLSAQEDLEMAIRDGGVVNSDKALSELEVLKKRTNIVVFLTRVLGAAKDQTKTVWIETKDSEAIGFVPIRWLKSVVLLDVETKAQRIKESRAQAERIHLREVEQVRNASVEQERLKREGPRIFGRFGFNKHNDYVFVSEGTEYVCNYGVRLGDLGNRKAWIYYPLPYKNGGWIPPQLQIYLVDHAIAGNVLDENGDDILIIKPPKGKAYLPSHPLLIPLK